MSATRQPNSKFVVLRNKLTQNCCWSTLGHEDHGPISQRDSEDKLLYEVIAYCETDAEAIAIWKENYLAELLA